MVESRHVGGHSPPAALGLAEGTALALGSIAGSGMLFTPSLSYALAGQNVLLAWAGAVALCLPLLVIFIQMARAVPREHSLLEEFVSRGLGRHAGAAVPALMLCVVVMGAPAGALVAGRYLSRSLNAGPSVAAVCGAGILATALAVNLAGLRLAGRLQIVLAWLMLVCAMALVPLSTSHVAAAYAAVVPSTAGLAGILPGMVVAFWAFAGFENLTLVAPEFRNPRRDFPLAILTAVAVYGAVSVALTVDLASAIGPKRLDRLAGLSQLAASAGRLHLAVLWTIGVLAALLMVTNNAAWLWGMSRLIRVTALAGRLPGVLARTGQDGVPRRAVLGFTACCAVAGALFVVVPSLLERAFLAASSFFLLVYCLCLGSYLRQEQRLARRGMALGLLIVLVVMLVGAGWPAVCPVVVLASSVAASLWRGRSPGAQRRRPTWLASRPPSSNLEGIDDLPGPTDVDLAAADGVGTERHAARDCGGPALLRQEQLPQEGGHG